MASTIIKEGAVEAVIARAPNELPKWINGMQRETADEAFENGEVAVCFQIGGLTWLETVSFYSTAENLVSLVSWASTATRLAYKAVHRG